MIKNFLEGVIKHPRITLVIVLLLTAIFGSFIPKVNFSSGVEDFFISNDPERLFYEQVKKVFGEDEVTVIAMVSPPDENIFTRERMLKLKDISEKIEKFEGVQKVLSLTNVQRIYGGEKTINVEQLMPDIPDSPEEWAALESALEENPMYEQNLVSRDYRTAAINVFLKDIGKNDEILYEIMEKITTLLNEQSGPEKFYVSGIAATQAETNNAMINDLRRFFPLTFLFITIVLIVSFRSLVGVLVPLSTVIMGSVWTVGFMGMTDISMSLVTIILPPLIITIGTAYSIHVMSEYIEEITEDATSIEIVSTALNKVALPTIICGFTTIIGFGSLGLNRIPTIRDLGIAAVAGVFFSAALALTVVPAVLTMLPKMRVPVKTEGNEVSKKPGMLDEFLASLAEFDLRHRVLILVFCMALAVAGVMGSFKMQVDTDFLTFFKDDDPITIANKVQQKYLAGAAPFFVILDAGEPDSFKDPSLLRRLELLQNWMTEQVEGVDFTLSIADYVKLLGKVFNNNDQAYFRIPETQRQVAQYLLFYSFSGDPDDFSPYINGDYSEANIMVRSRIVGSTDTEAAIKKIENYARTLFKDQAHVRVTGTIRMVNKSANEVAIGQFKGIITCLLAIFLVMSVLFKSPKTGFLTMIPNILPIVVLFGVMGYTGITLNFSTGIIACIAIGLGVDDTIHLMSRHNKELKEVIDSDDSLRRTLKIVGKPVIYTSMSLFFGFMIIAGSDFVPLRQFGLLTAMSIITCLLADLALLPALTSTMRVTVLWDYVDLGIGRERKSEISIFKGLSAKQSQAASLMCVFGFYSKDEPVVRQGEAVKDLFVVLDGRVRAVNEKENGEEEVLERLSEGMHFGWRPGSEPGPSPVSWIAETTTKLLVINPLTIDRLKTNFPKIAEKVEKNIEKEGCPMSELQNK